MVPANGATYAGPYGTVIVPSDGRAGGVPDPRAAGPAIVQIGNEGGFLKAPVTMNNPPLPVAWAPNGTVNQVNLLVGGAQRADVIIDFSQLADGTKLILYNDAPAPFPGGDPRYDYYTADPDNTTIGGSPTTTAGVGPNTRTVMQFIVTSPTASAPFNATALATAMTGTYGFAADQDPLPIPAGSYLNVRTKEGDIFSTPTGSYPVHLKSINGVFDAYGRISVQLGTQLSSLNTGGPAANGMAFVDPITENLPEGQTQIWGLVNNDVDTHFVHFHLLDMQVINRVDFANTITPPFGDENGWRETIRFDPMTITFLAVRPKRINTPFVLPKSSRPLDVTMPPTGPLGSVYNKTTNPNPVTDFGQQYVWHCHILGHEENDMMRPLVMRLQNIGVFRNGLWYLDQDQSGVWTTGPGNGTVVTTFPYATGDIPVMGDWTGDGSAKIGTFNNGVWKLDLNGDNAFGAADATYNFGTTGDIPVVGDWTGDGKAKIGVFRNGAWYLNTSGDGKTVGAVYFFGTAGDVPVASDWKGSSADGKAKIGVFRNGVWYLNLNGDGKTVGATYFFGTTGDQPIVGDWDGSGKAEIGAFRNGVWYLNSNGDGATVGTVYSSFGTTGDKPVAGKW